MNMLAWIGGLLSYLLGSVCSAVLVARALGTTDPRTDGSRNPGATNMLRVAGTKAALMTLCADAMKGVLAVGLGYVLQLHGFALTSMLLLACLGHAFPLFFQFQGGKGVATALGGMCALHLTLGIILGLVWLVVCAVTRYASLSSLVVALLIPIFTLFHCGLPCFVPMFGVSLLLFWQHRHNIARLKTGTESHIQFRFPVF